MSSNPHNASLSLDYAKIFRRIDEIKESRTKAPNNSEEDIINKFRLKDNRFSSNNNGKFSNKNIHVKSPFGGFASPFVRKPTDSYNSYNDIRQKKDIKKDFSFNNNSNNFLNKKRKYLSKEEEKEYIKEMQASDRIDRMLEEIKREKQRKLDIENKKKEEAKKKKIEEKKKKMLEEKKVKKNNFFLDALGITEEDMKKANEKERTISLKEEYNNDLKKLLNKKTENSVGNFGEIKSGFISKKEELPKYWNFKVKHGDIYQRLLSFEFYNSKTKTELIPDHFDNELHYRYIWVPNFYNELKYCLLNEKAEKSDLQNYKDADIKVKFTYVSQEFDNIALLRIYSNKNLNEFKKKILKDKDIIAIYPEKENINFDDITIFNKDNLNYFLGVIKRDLDSYELKILIHSKDVEKYDLNYNKHVLNPKKEEYFKIKYLNNVNSPLREFNALLCLELSNFKDILNPKNLLISKNNIENEEMNTNDKKETFIKNINSSKIYNSSQTEIITKANNMKKNKLLLIQGPPGTGKTHTILGLTSLFMLEKNVKILICAQSNTAIDEICNRLMNKGLYDEKLNKIKSNFIRFGYTDRRDKEKKYLDTKQGKLLEKYSLEYLTDSKFREQLENANFEKEKIAKELNSLSANKEKNAEQIKILENKKQVLMKALTKNKHEKANYEYYLLSNTPILCTTLNNAGNERLKKNNLSYDYLIIDEACQCVEPSSLIPLSHGIKKLILVGDHKQLPATVFYPKAKNILYNRSLFERLLDNNIPRHILTIQYRMQTNIRKFISDLFYESKLTDSPNKDYIDKINTNPFYSMIDINKNFSFFDLNFSEESFNQLLKSYYNKQEIDFVFFLMKKINSGLRNMDREKEYKYAVITPYQAQVKKFKEEKNRYNEFYNLDIAINTVDSFQGQERDIERVRRLSGSDPEPVL